MLLVAEAVAGLRLTTEAALCMLAKSSASLVSLHPVGAGIRAREDGHACSCPARVLHVAELAWQYIDYV